jgi:carbonic anhydrase
MIRNERPGLAGWRSILRTDVPASFVVVLIALPLSLGIALASGAPLVAGLVAAVVGGVVAGALGGSAVQVTGPAAGLTLIVSQMVVTFGWRGACAITIGAGMIQLALSAFRVAGVALAVSPAVAHGMLAGVGVIIVMSQLHVLLGDTPQASVLANLRDLPGELLHNRSPAVAVGVITLAVLIGWRKLPVIGPAVPAPLGAIVVGTLVVVVTGWEVPRIVFPEQLLATVAAPVWPSGSPSMIVAAVGAVAIVASVESMLCAVAVDRLHTGPRVRLNRELAGQGLANIVSGCLGGLPVAGVIVRSTAAVNAGGRTRLVAILHGVWLLVLVLAAAPVIELIPLPALAALLVYTGVKMLNLAHARDVHRHGETFVYLVTLLAVITIGLFEGVLAGVICAAVLAGWRLTRTHVKAEPSDEGWRVTADGSLTFLTVPKLARALAQIPARAKVLVELNADFMDHAAISALQDWHLGHERAGGTVKVHELHQHWYGDSIAGHKARSHKTRPAPRWLPWTRHLTRTGVGGTGHLAHGARRFQRDAPPHLAPLMAELARTGQQPTQLFITCADARVVPSLITDSGPGDLFTIRNVGNLVPRSGDKFGGNSVMAAVEYALAMLPITTITVCGHSHCGALAAVLNPPPGLSALPSLQAWLRGAGPSLSRMKKTEAAGPDPLSTLCQLNVVTQLDNLRSHSVIRDRIAQGRLELTGMYFDLPTSRVHLYDPKLGEFRPVGPAVAVSSR